jgi:hypothetical protein
MKITASYTGSYSEYNTSEELVKEAVANHERPRSES